MATSNIGFVFERLKGRENFDVWKRHAKSYLVIKGCWKVVEKGLQADATDKDIQADERALAEITLMIEPINFSHIAMTKTAKEAWDALLSAYEDTGLTRKVDLLKQLVQCKLSDHASMQEYVNSLVMTSLKVQSAGLNIDEEVTASLMLAGLPDEFKALVMAIENSKEKLSIDFVKTALLQDAKFDNKESESVLYSKNKAKPKQFKCHCWRWLHREGQEAVALNKYYKEQKQLVKAAAEKRTLTQKLEDIRNSLNHIYKDMKIYRTKEAYLDLAKQEIELCEMEKRYTDLYKVADIEEQDLFSDFSTAINESYEKEKLHTNFIKVISIIGTITSSFVALILSILFHVFQYNKFRKDKPFPDDVLKSINNRLGSVEKALYKRESWGSYLYRHTHWVYSWAIGSK